MTLIRTAEDENVVGLQRIDEVEEAEIAEGEETEEANADAVNAETINAEGTVVSESSEEQASDASDFLRVIASKTLSNHCQVLRVISKNRAYARLLSFHFSSHFV